MMTVPLDKKGLTVIAIVIALMAVLITAGVLILSKVVKPQKVRYSRDVVLKAKESIIGFAVANKRLPATISDAGARSVDEWGNALEYSSAGNITASNLCTTEPALLTVNTDTTIAFIVFSKGPDGTNNTGTGPFTVSPPSDTYDDIAEYVKIENLRKKVCHDMRITTESLPAGKEEVAYPSTTLEATDGTPSYTWSVIGQTAGTNGCTGTDYPISSTNTGLCLSQNGIISSPDRPRGFDPRITRDYTFTASVLDAEGREARKQLTLTIQPNEPRITTGFLHDGIENQSYTAQLTTTGGLSPYTYSIFSGFLPPGLNLSGDTITGTLNAGPYYSSYTFTVRVTDNRVRTNERTLKIKVRSAAVVCPALNNTTPSPLPSGTVGSAYSANITYTGGQPPVTCSIPTGTLPTGLTRTGCTISGTPTIPGTYNFTTRVTDSCTPTPQTSDVATSITISCPPFTGWSSSLSNATNCLSYAGSITVFGGYPLYSWLKTAGNLPGGISFCTGNTTATCNLTGTPLASPSTYNFTTQVTDSCTPTPQTTSNPFSITVNADSCYAGGIRVRNQSGATRYYRRNLGPCTSWGTSTAASITVLPQDSYLIYSNATCITSYCSSPVTYCQQKPYDTDRDCLTQMNALCVFVDR